ncbi:hypothetical protein ACH51_07235 [Ralstonia solanacearum]|nr:hypothetical protein ACH51_07235 [Ralstonia solanacearum]
MESDIRSQAMRLSLADFYSDQALGTQYGSRCAVGSSTHSKVSLAITQEMDRAIALLEYSLAARDRSDSDDEKQKEAA